MEDLRQIWCQQHRSLSQLLFLRAISSKIFVKGLAFSTTKEKLAEAFLEYGNVLNDGKAAAAEKKNSKDETSSKDSQGLLHAPFSTSF